MTRYSCSVLREAIHRGYSALFVPAAVLSAHLVQAYRQGRFEEKLSQCAKPKLLIQLVARRYERGSIRAVGEWGAVFGDSVVATAILDRLLHHRHMMTIRGESYRLKDKRRSGLLKHQTLEAGT